MRARKKKYTAERLTRQGSLVLSKLEFYNADWKNIFGNDHPIHLELGCGKGSFITETANRNPEINFVAMEKIPDVIVMAAERASEGKVTNVRFVNGDAAFIHYAFRPDSLDGIYINFCDPWLKKKQHKRRLTHHNFLDIYKFILKDGGKICFKTDNRELFDFSLEEIGNHSGFILQNVTYDLHHSGFEGNIVTEYEAKFSSQGLPIHRLEAVKKQRD